MKPKLTPEIEEKLLGHGVKLNKLVGLSRILFDCIQNGENLKPYDSAILSHMPYKTTKKTYKKFVQIEEELGI